MVRDYLIALTDAGVESGELPVEPPGARLQALRDRLKAEGFEGVYSALDG